MYSISFVLKACVTHLVHFTTTSQLDGNPSLNLASFVTTYMDQEANHLMSECCSVNIIDIAMYPQSAGLEASSILSSTIVYH